MIRRYTNWFALLLIVNLCTTIIVLSNKAIAAKTLEDLVSENELSILPHFKVGERPNDIAIGELGFVYVSNRDSQSVSVIDSNTMKVFDLRVENDPLDILSYSGWVYVANTGSDSVSVINGINNTIESRIPVGNAPVDIAPGFDKVYVANAGSNNVSVISTTSNKEIARISVGDNPMNIGSITMDSNSMLYVTNHDSNDVSVINGSIDKEIARIPVGKWPGAIEVDIDRIYVVNSDGSSSKNYTVSVINRTANIEMKRISVGMQPSDIIVDQGYIYVSNSWSDTVSVFNSSNYKQIKTIPVGIYPDQMVLDRLEKKDKLDKIYVINSGSVTKNVNSNVSVINTSNNSEIARIPVGKWPMAIANDGDTVYVTNFDSNSVTVFDGRSLEVQTGVSFDVKPSNAGRVICNNLTIPTNVHFYLDYGTSCTAESIKGFQFTGWTEVLGLNSTRIISNVGSSDSFWNQFYNNLGLGEKDTLSDLNITRFGSFVATFEKIPPAIPPEYLIGLYTIVVSSIIGYSIPSIITWYKSKNQSRTLFEYHKRIKSLTIDKNFYENIQELDSLKNVIDKDYSKGKMSDKQYEYIKSEMKNEISTQYVNVFKKKIDSLEKTPTKDRHDLIIKIASELDEAYANDGLSELHYDLMMKRVSKYKERQ